MTPKPPPEAEAQFQFPPVILDEDYGWDRLAQLEHACLNDSAPFSCGGSIPVPTDPAPALFFRNGDAFSAVSLPLGPDALAQLLAATQPAPFGRNAETVFDESYRAAHEIRPPGFALSLDPVLEANVLPTICASMNINGSLQARATKLNVYTEGGFFKAHRDTPHGANHIGTVTVCLPSEFTGGELVVRQNGREHTYGWGSDGRVHSSDVDDDDDYVGSDPDGDSDGHILNRHGYSAAYFPSDSDGSDNEDGNNDTSDNEDGNNDTAPNENTSAEAPATGVASALPVPAPMGPAISWAFLYSDCEHEVLPVTSGTRVTLAYDIFQSKSKSRPTDRAASPVAGLLKQFMEDKKFFPEGTELAFALQHGYPCKAFQGEREKKAAVSLPRLQRQLKGADRSLLRALRTVGLNPRLIALYSDQNREVDDYYEKQRVMEMQGKGGDLDALHTVERKPFDMIRAAAIELYDPTNREQWRWDQKRDMKQPLGRIMANYDECIHRLGVKYRKKLPAYKERHFIASDSFYYYKDQYIYGEAEDLDPADPAGCGAHWITAPRKWGGENHYMTYGNEAQHAIVYIAAAVVVDIPPADSRSRPARTAYRGAR